MKKLLMSSTLISILLISFTSQGVMKINHISNELKNHIETDIHIKKDKSSLLLWKYTRMDILDTEPFFNVQLWHKDKMIGSLIYDCTMKHTTFRVYAINRIINLSDSSINSLNKEFCKT